VRPWEADAALALAPVERRVVCVPVKAFDRRSVRTVLYALRISASRCCAVHVSRDPRATHALAMAWMEVDPPVPLVVVDDLGGLVPSIASALVPELDQGADEIVVVMSRLVERRCWTGQLPDRHTERMARQLSSLPGVRVLLLSVSVGDRRKP